MAKDALLVVGHPRGIAIANAARYLRSQGIEPQIVRIEVDKLNAMLQDMSTQFDLVPFDPATALDLDTEDETWDPEDEVDIFSDNHSAEVDEIFSAIIGIEPDDVLAILWKATDYPIMPVDFGILREVTHIQVLVNGKMMISMPKLDEDDQDD